VASAEPTTSVAAAAPATVLGESWMRRDGEDGSESKCGKEPPRRGEDSQASRRRLARARGNRVGWERIDIMALDGAGKCAAGKLAVDCVVF
jgi:hypothetical protein